MPQFPSLSTKREAMYIEPSSEPLLLQIGASRLFLCEGAWSDAVVPILRMRKLNLWEAGVSPKVTQCWNQAHREVVGRALPLCQAAFHSSARIPRAESLHSSAAQSSPEAWDGEGREDKVQVGSAVGGGDKGALAQGQGKERWRGRTLLLLTLHWPPWMTKEVET